MRGCSRGFSLIELVVVIGIITVLAAMIVPTIGPMRRQGRMRVGAATVAESLRLARSLAITQSAIYSVDSPSATQIRIYSGLGAYVSPSSLVQVAALPDGVVRESLLPASVSFQPDGSCLGTGMVVVIRDAELAKEKRTIEVKATSGRVSVSGGSR